MMIDHDIENRTLLIRWGGNYSISEDHGNYVLDFDENGKVIGIELFYFDPTNEHIEIEENE